MNNEGVSSLFGQVRYFILSISTVCLTFFLANALALNFTVICMDDVIAEHNATYDEPHWLQSSQHTNYLFSAVAIGCLIGSLPLSHLTAHFGIGKVIVVYGLLSSLSTIFLPLAVNVGYVAVLICRILQGISISLTYPAVGMISAQWSTLKGVGTFISILCTHVQFGSIVAMPLAGGLCGSSWGWRSLYYILGIITLICVIIFTFFYKDEPEKHRYVGVVELKKIKSGKDDQIDRKSIPYRKLITDPCVLSIWLTSIGANLGIQIFLLYGPVYMNKVQGLDVESTGTATALPFVLSAIVKFSLGPVSDRLTCLRDRTSMVFFASISQGVMAICFVVLSYAKSPLVAQISYTTAIVFSGVNAVGTVKCANKVFCQYVHCVMTVISILLCGIVLLIPVAVGYFCPNNSPEEWATLFRIVAVIVVLASTPFVFTARDQPAEWMKHKVNPESVKVSVKEESGITKSVTVKALGQWSNKNIT